MSALQLSPIGLSVPETPSPWASPPPIRQPRGARLPVRSRAQGTAASGHKWFCSTRPGPRRTKRKDDKERAGACTAPAPGRLPRAKGHQQECITSGKPCLRGSDLPAVTTHLGSLTNYTSAYMHVRHHSKASCSPSSCPASRPWRPPDHGGLWANASCCVRLEWKRAQMGSVRDAQLILIYFMQTLKKEIGP